jgi:hypothetical protein
MEPQFKNPSTIGHYTRNLNSWLDGGWLFIRADAKIALDTPCVLQGWVGKELSPEEQEECESSNWGTVIFWKGDSYLGSYTTWRIRSPISQIQN